MHRCYEVPNLSASPLSFFLARVPASTVWPVGVIDDGVTMHRVSHYMDLLDVQCWGMFKGKHLCGFEKGVGSNHMLDHGVLSLILGTPVAGFNSSASVKGRTIASFSSHPISERANELNNFLKATPNFLQSN